MNEPKHTLAALRRMIGLKQKELAALVNRSLATIQAIEYGEMPISEGLGKTISAKTGVSLEWLMDNNLAVPIVGERAKPYTKETFERAVSNKNIGATDSFGCVWQATALVGMVARASLAALQAGELPLMQYRFLKAISEAGSGFPGYERELRLWLEPLASSYESLRGPDIPKDSINTMIMQVALAGATLLDEFYLEAAKIGFKANKRAKKRRPARAAM